MTGSGSGSKGLYITIGVIIVILIVWGFYTKLNEIDEKVDTLANNQKTRPNENSGKETTIDITPEKVTESVVQAETTTAIVPQVETIPGIRFSDDFGTVNKNGQEYHLTTNQARITERLWIALQNKTPEVHQSTLLESLEIYSKRVRDVFKNSPALGTLIVKGERKGHFRLNLG